MLQLANNFGVGLGVEEGVEGAGIGYVDFDDPGFFVGRFVDELGGVIEIAIGFDDGSGDGHEKVAGCFYGLNDPEGFTGLERIVEIGHFNESDIAEAALGVIGDPDEGGAIVEDLNPFVFCGVF